MAKKYSDYPIPNLDSDWIKNPTDGYPQSGKQVQEFLRDQLGKSVGAAWFNDANTTLYFFRSAEDRDAFAQDQSRTELVVSSTKLNLSSQMRRVSITNYLPSYNVQASTNQTSVVLSLGFVVQTKAVSDTSWQDTADAVHAAAYIDVGNTGNYVLIPNSEQLLTYGTQYDIDVRELLEAGNNRVKIVMTDENDDTVSASVVYSVLLSEMYIEEMNNTWYNAIVEGESTNYKLGGFKIVGALYKTLHIEIYQGSQKLLEFEKPIGTSSYTDVPYYYTAEDELDLSTLQTGVYICKAYLTAEEGSITSLPVSYNFMYVAAADRSTARLVCVNNVADKVSNYSTATLCDYAIYNAGFSKGDPHILIQFWSGTTPTTKVDTDYAGITTSEVHTLEYTIEWLTEATINLFAYFQITLGSSSQVQSIPIDNSAVYPAEAGAAFYLNATTRSNNDTNKTSIINDAASPSTEIEATWENMSWVDGIDGWTADEDGRKALLIPAGSKCTIPYQVMTGDNMTFEICFKVANVSDYTENIITAADNATQPGFSGIRIRPTDFTIHSAADIDASNDTNSGTSFGDEEVVHLMVVIQNSFGGHTGYNLVTCYVNGCKALQFKYASGTAWAHTADFIIGSSSADVYVYFCRIYRKALGVKAAEQNYINSLPALEDRASASAWFNSVLNESTHELLYDKVVNSPNNYNFFVVEMKNGVSVPSRANNWAKDTKGYSDFEMHYGGHPEWDFKLFGVETSGQGTTSMDYYRWNIRWRIDKTNTSKKIPVAYYGEPSVGLDGKKVFNILPSEDSKTVFFDGGHESNQQHPAVMRITAKINMASSMQSHKIGATKAYTALHDYIGLKNEAQVYAEENNLPMPAVAVYQYPAFGFSRTVSAQGVVSYGFIGLFTIGPDKGDKPTFGYNISDDIKNSLITLEGTDHSRRMARFQYPWNSEVEYRASNECINIVIGNNDFDNAWEVSNCHGLSTDEATDQQAIQGVLVAEFKPAYEVAWNNSTLIFPVALDDAEYGGATATAVLANINAAAETFRNKTYNSRFGYADMEFWIEGEYLLYHYDIVTGQYVAGINLETQNGTPAGNTLDAQNEWFKGQRRARFLAQAPNYWDIQDCAYHLAFCIIIGATDNFAKNTYPYKMAQLANGGRWKWRQDDLDSIFDTGNRGSDTKPYYIEFTDAENGSVVFAGSTSVFWNLLYEVFWVDYGVNKGIESIGKTTVTSMATLGGGANTYSGIVNFFKKYFWDNAQNYFPPSAYNVDGNFKYELAWLANGQAVEPLSQSMGRHLEAEHLWCARRAIYIMSLFKVGAFAQYSDTSLGQIAFRPQSLASITVTPMMWMYPALANGAGSPEATARTRAGQSYTFIGPFGTDGQTPFYIQASNYLTSIGDWKDLQLAAQYVDNITIVGAKLRTFKIGDEEEPVTTNVPSLTFDNTKCLEEIDARNAASLSGSIDLSVCTRLRRAYFEGTNITQVTLPSGSKIEALHLGDATNTLLLKNLKFLTDLQLPSDLSRIRTLQVENCTHQDAFGILRQLYNTSGTALQYIRIIFQGTTNVDADDVTMLSFISQNKKKNGTIITYQGINAQGNIEGRPVIEGQIQLTSGIYLEDLETLGVINTEPWQGGLERALSSVFGTLYIIYNPNIVYVYFADPEVRRIAVAAWGSEGGVTLASIQSVTALSQRFRNNTLIETFDELEKFTGLTQIGNRDFGGCTALRSVKLPNTITTIDQYAFYGCTALASINLPSGVQTIGYSAFDGVPAQFDVNLPSLTSLGTAAFHASGVVSVQSLGTITALQGLSRTTGTFQGCTHLDSVTLPQTLQSIGQYDLAGCTALESITIPSAVASIGLSAFYGDSSLRVVTCLASTPPTLSTGVFTGCTSLTHIYVPYGCGQAYKTATNWTAYASKIYELDQDGNIPE